MTGQELFIPLAVLGADLVCDLKKREIYPVLTLTGAAAGTAEQALVRETDPVLILGCLLPGVLFLLLSFLCGGQIGMGDALVLFVTGAWTDPFTVWKILMIGSAAAAAAAGILWLKKRRNTTIPFVPFLALGFVWGVIG